MSMMMMMTTMKSYRQRVVTRRDAAMYHYAPDDLQDCSPPLVDLEAFPVTCLRISCQFSSDPRFRTGSRDRDHERLPEADSSHGHPTR